MDEYSELREEDDYEGYGASFSHGISFSSENWREVLAPLRIPPQLQRLTVSLIHFKDTDGSDSDDGSGSEDDNIKATTSQELVDWLADVAVIGGAAPNNAANAAAIIARRAQGYRGKPRGDSESDHIEDTDEY